MIVKSTQFKGQKTVGGKAASLFMLRRMGIAVPDFIVLTSDCFNFLPSVENKKQAAEARQALLGYSLPDLLKTQILTDLGGMGFPQKAVVVRSSAGV